VLSRRKRRRCRPAYDASCVVVENFAAPGLYAPAELPADFAEAELTSRPTYTPGSQPRAAVLLLEMDVQGLVLAS
jgi:hypothetical protein